MRESGLLQGGPNELKKLVLLSFNAHLVASFLFNIGMFLTAGGDGLFH